MNAFETELRRRLENIQEQGLERELRRIDSPQDVRIEMKGRTYLNFSSNDYLGLANESALKEAAIRAVEKFGAGSGASRLICGSLAPHHELEEILASFKGTEAALTFSSGYAAALGTICALLGKEDVIVIDRLVHACIVDAAKLSGAKLRVFAHNDLYDLENILNWRDRRPPACVSTAESSGKGPEVRSPRTLIVTESLFSMDGDQAPLRHLVELKEKYGAWLMIDEAHATGLYGPRRRGLAEAWGVSDRIEIQMGTLGKALGASGGYICGSRALIDYLVNRARSFIFSTAPIPAAAAAASAGVRFVQSSAGTERCAALWARVRQFAQANSGDRPDIQQDEFGNRSGQTPAKPDFSAIIPLIVGAESEAMEAATRLRSDGIFVPAIRYPTVERGAARLRVAVTAAHTPEEIDQLVSALKRFSLIPHSALRTPHSSNEQVR